jgi:putative ABC transport system substrate-binding protein
MDRRDFITLLGGAAAWPLAARAQQNVRRLGLLMHFPATDLRGHFYVAALVQGLREAGWVEGQNLRIDIRWNPGDRELARTYAAQLIGLLPDVIVVSTTVNLSAIRQATNSVPVVFLAVADPVTQGFVPSVKQPGGMITGFSLLELSLGGKWVELLKQVAPGLARVGVVSNPDSPLTRSFMPAIEAAAPSLGVEVTPVAIRSTVDIESGLASVARMPNGGLLLAGDPFANSYQMLIADLARSHRLPSISSAGDFAKDGGLIGYGPGVSLEGQFRQAAAYVDRILKGAKPGDLPVQAPTKYTLTINLKTAKAIGLTVPESLLIVADEVIE